MYFNELLIEAIKLNKERDNKNKETKITLEDLEKKQQLEEWKKACIADINR